MANELSGYTVGIFGRLRGLFAWPIIICGLSADGKSAVPISAGSSGSGGIVLGGKQETDTWSVKTNSYTVPAGALSIGFSPSSDFVGTVQGVAWTGAMGPISRVAQPGNTLPAFVVVLTSGTNFIVAVAT